MNMKFFESNTDENFDSGKLSNRSELSFTTEDSSLESIFSFYNP